MFDTRTDATCRAGRDFGASGCCLAGCRCLASCRCFARHRRVASGLAGRLAGGFARCVACGVTQSCGRRRRRLARPAAAAAPPTGTPIKVGVMDDVTGVGAIEGALMRISTDLVVQRTNASGGINGHPLKVVYVDPKGDATQALQLATQLAQQDNVDVLAGGLFSPECLGVQGLAVEAADGLHADSTAAPATC